MKRCIMTLAAVLMCFSMNAFAEDDGYGNDVPVASEKTASVYRDFSSAGKSETSAARDLSVDPFHFGVHMGIGLGGYWDYPDLLGENDWFNVGFDVGCAFNIRVNQYLRVVPELNFGLVVSSRDLGDDISENRGAYGINIPVAVRFTPTRQFYLETGARMAFNFASSHTYSGSDYLGRSVSKSASEIGGFVWEAKTFVPSLIFGLGGTFKASSSRDIDVGARFVLDLGGIEKYDNLYVTDGYRLGIVENKTKMWNIQLVVNYYFGSLL